MKPEYRLPFPIGIEKRLVDTRDHPNSQKPESRYSVHFILEKGTPILAARSGTIIEVITDPLEKIVDDEIQAHTTNSITINHGDKTYTQYIHVSPSVQRGQKVESGDFLGKLHGHLEKYGSHLHFNAYKITKGKALSIPIRFT